MVTLSINDFTTGEFALSVNQNNIINDFDFEKAVKTTLLKGLGIDFFEDYENNPTEYNDILSYFYFERNHETKISNGLIYALKSIIKSELLNWQRTGLSDYGATVPIIEAAQISDREIVKWYNRGVKEFELLAYYVAKEFDIKTKNTYQYWVEI